MTPKPKRPPLRPYHHGDLKAALLKEAEAILESEGVQGLTLRAIARRAGVSHAAPNNHFGDLTGLLSELAARGFRRFGQAVAEAMDQAGDDPAARMTAMGRAYVAVAYGAPGMFALMFRSELLDSDRPALREAIADVRAALRAATLARAPDSSLTPLKLAAQATAAWSLVHGFSLLLLDGRLEGTLRALPGERDVGALLDAVLEAMRLTY